MSLIQLREPPPPPAEAASDVSWQTRLERLQAWLSRYRRAYVNGRRWAGALAAVPLRRHAEIVLEVGPFVRPHSTFLFRKGL